MAVLHGNLAPRGAVYQAFGGQPHCCSIPAARWCSNREDMTERVDDPALDVTADDVLCCATRDRRARRACRKPAICRFRKARACGREGHGADIDARMSGTAFGTIVLHITPESAVGGPLALGGERRHDSARCRETQHRSAGDDAELKKRHAALVPATTPEWAARGYAHLFNETILQAR